MKHVDHKAWDVLKQQAAEHLESSGWLGGVFCVNRPDVGDRPALPIGPWEALLSRDPPSKSAPGTTAQNT